jgi:hypothetical protein
MLKKAFFVMANTADADEPTEKHVNSACVYAVVTMTLGATREQAMADFKAGWMDPP